MRVSSVRNQGCKRLDELLGDQRVEEAQVEVALRCRVNNRSIGRCGQVLLIRLISLRLRLEKIYVVDHVLAGLIAVQVFLVIELYPDSGH